MYYSLLKTTINTSTTKSLNKIKAAGLGNRSRLFLDPRSRSRLRKKTGAGAAPKLGKCICYSTFGFLWIKTHLFDLFYSRCRSRLKKKNRSRLKKTRSRSREKISWLPSPVFIDSTICNMYSISHEYTIKY